MGDLNDNLEDDKTPVEEDAGPSIGEKIVGGIGSIISNAANKWEDYTSDVREEVPDDELVPADVAGSVGLNSANTVAKSVGRVKPVKRARGILGAFVDGIVGRPHVSSSEKRNGGTMRIVIKTVAGIFSVIGVVAVIRASIDAFKPRR